MSVVRALGPGRSSDCKACSCRSRLARAEAHLAETEMRPSVEPRSLPPNVPRTGSRFFALRDWRTAISYLVCLVFFVSLSAGHAVSVGPLTAEADEFVAGLTILALWILWGRSPSTELPHRRRGRWIIRAFSGIASWSILLWLVGNNWRDRSLMVWDWVLCALLVYLLLGQVRLNWEGVAFAFALASIPNSVMAIYQHFAGLGFGYKDLLGWMQASAGGSRPVSGFFSFPNTMAAYLLWPFVISVGSAFQGSRVRRILSGLCAVLGGGALLWSYSRTAILTAAAALILCAIMALAKSRRGALLGLGIAGFVTAIGAAAILARRSFMDLSSHRPLLWAEALRIIASDRYLLVTGFLNTYKRSAFRSPWWVPHNIYLMLWMQFGVLGTAFLLGMLGYAIWLGWTGYPGIRKRPLLLASWGVLLVFFFVEGMATNDLLEPYSLLTFAMGVCIVLGLAEQALQLGRG